MSGVGTSEGGSLPVRRKPGKLNVQAAFDITRRRPTLSMTQWGAIPSRGVPRFLFYDDTRITPLFPLIPATDDSSSALSQDGSTSYNVAAYGVNTFDGIGGTFTYKSPLVAAALHHSRKFGKGTSSFVLRGDVLSARLPAAVTNAVPASAKLNDAAANSGKAFSHLSASVSVTRVPSAKLLTTFSLQASSKDQVHHGQAQVVVDDSTLHTQYVNTATPHRPLGLQCVLSVPPRGPFEVEKPQGLLSRLWNALPVMHFEGQIAYYANKHPVTGERASSLFGERAGVSAAVDSAVADFKQKKPASVAELPVAAASAAAAAAPALGLPTQERPWGIVGVNVATTGIAQVVGSVQVLPSVKATLLFDTDVHGVVNGLSGVPTLGESIKQIPVTFAWGLRYN